MTEMENQNKNQVYDIVLFQNGGEAINAGKTIATLRVADDTGNGIDIVGVAKKFFSEIDFSATDISEPTVSVMKQVANVESLSELNDLLATMSSYNYKFYIIKRIDISSNIVDDDVDIQATGYLLLPKQNIDELSVSLLFNGWGVTFAEIPTLSVMSMAILKLVQAPKAFRQYSGITDDIAYFDSLVAAGDVSAYSNLNSLNYINALGYTYAILI